MPSQTWTNPNIPSNDRQRPQDRPPYMEGYTTEEIARGRKYSIGELIERKQQALGDLTPEEIKQIEAWVWWQNRNIKNSVNTNKIDRAIIELARQRRIQPVGKVKVK